jgi:hypothetical protein
MLKRSIILSVICITLVGCQKNTCDELQKAVGQKIDQTNPQKYEMLLKNCPDRSIQEKVSHTVLTRGSFQPSPVVNW